MEHDNGYKLLFSEPEMVIDLLKGFVGGAWLEQCDFSSLEKVSGSYVTDDLRSREDDIIWRIRMDDAHKGSSGWLHIYLLLEFQSTVDLFMAVRIQAYTALLCQDIIRAQNLKAGDKLPPILPIVLYNGKQRWQAPVQLGELIHPLPAGLERYNPKLGYLLLDEGSFSKDDLSGLKNLVAALFLLENSRTRQDITDVFLKLIDWFKAPGQESIRRTLIVWLNRVLLPNKAPNIHFAEFIDFQEGVTMLSETIDEWGKGLKAEGEAKGLAEGLAKGLAKGEAKLFLRLLTKRFGAVNPDLQEKIQTASPEQIEAWTDDIFQAGSPEELLTRTL